MRRLFWGSSWRIRLWIACFRWMVRLVCGVGGKGVYIWSAGGVEGRGVLVDALGETSWM